MPHSDFTTFDAMTFDEVQTLSRSVQENQDRLAALAETTASSFAETLALLERLILRADEDQPEPL